MKEKIYTIPVTEAFSTDCECPLCILEKKLEDEYISYTLGPSLMEPDGRTVTNDKGFCRNHFELLFNSKANTLGLGLIMDTFLTEQNARLNALIGDRLQLAKKDTEISALKNFASSVSSKQTETDKLVDKLIEGINRIENSCTVCSKLSYTMDRYIDVILYLWKKEADFRRVFESKKGFCLGHLKDLLEGCKKYLDKKEAAQFITMLIPMQMENMKRLQEEVNWFCKKFDYRYNDAPWGNSKDSVARSIQKIAGHSKLDR